MRSINKKIAINAFSKGNTLHINWPKISVVTPSFNQGQYIRETIESVISQGYPNIEYIVIDGGSTDETLAVVAEYENSINYFVSEPDNGQSHAINKGFAQATGDILCWLNSDDKFAPNALWAAAMAFHVSNADLIAGICEIYEDDKLTHRHMTSCADGELPLHDMLDLDNGWNAGQFFYQPEVFFTRALWQGAGGHVRENCYYSMDYELWCRFAYQKANIKVIGVPLVHFRTHAEQKTADTEKFKAELLKVRDEFCQANGISWRGSTRPKVDWTKHLRVAMVNDLGYQYGAGIAHMRLAGSLELAGHQVSSFTLSAQDDSPHYFNLLSEIKKLSPDVILFGNFHGVEKTSISLLEQLEEQYRCIWLTHDFWLFSGACPYPNLCDDNANGCDESCLTQYRKPKITNEEMSDALNKKRTFLSSANNLSIATNSDWAQNIVEKKLVQINPDMPTHRVKLGVPTELFKPNDTNAARHKLEISQNEFVIAFSVSSLSDKRKGGKLLLDALKKCSHQNITLLLIGRLDQSIDLPNVRLLSLGYIEDVKDIVNALNAANIFVGPSIEETFGQVFVEAALCGTPSIGFDVSGVSEAITHGITGLKVSPLSPDALADAIDFYYQNPLILQQHAALAPVYARNEYSLEACYGRLFNVFNQMNLVDDLGLPHKISFAQSSRIITESAMGWSDLPLLQKINVTTRNGVNGLIGFLPNKFTAFVARCLPDIIERKLIHWLVTRI